MKIDRVLFVLNNNEIYTKFWNVVTPIWKEKFNIQPTLLFIGTEEEFQSNNFDINHDIIKIELDIANKYRWLLPWSLFWLATKYQDDVCLISGIDQIPLNDDFFECIKDIDNEKFIIGLSDAYVGYKPKTLGYFNTKSNVLYPTGQVVGLGKNFKKLFTIEDELDDELNKIYLNRNNFYLPYDLRGIDECYFSDIIENYIKKEEIVFLEYYKIWGDRRLYDISHLNIELLNQGYYSEYTSKTNSLIEIKKIIELRFG